jgi:hypothetical protein
MDRRDGTIKDFGRQNFRMRPTASMTVQTFIAAMRVAQSMIGSNA